MPTESLDREGGGGGGGWRDAAGPTLEVIKKCDPLRILTYLTAQF